MNAPCTAAHPHGFWRAEWWLYSPVLQDDEPDGEEERHPVLVQRDDADHDEVVEVHLDRPAGDLDEDGRRDHEAHRGQHGAHTAVAGHERGGRRHHRERGDEQRLDRAGADGFAAHEREDEDPRDVHPEEREDPTVALRPDVVRQARPGREPGSYLFDARGEEAGTAVSAGDSCIGGSEHRLSHLGPARSGVPRPAVVVAGVKHRHPTAVLEVASVRRSQG
jgi:hypothetical protein